MKITLPGVLRRTKAYVLALGIGFMVAWHNVYNSDDMLREETKIELTILEEEQEKDDQHIRIFTFLR